jgi:hypothetical protein
LPRSPEWCSGAASRFDADFIIHPGPSEPAPTLSVKGVAVDAQGNIYKMTF